MFDLAALTNQPTHMHRLFSQLLPLLFLAFLAACTDKAPKSPEAIGGDKDTHGCLPAAGYQWSVLKNDCIRLFESGIRLDAQAAGLDTTVSAFVVFKSAEDDAQAELFLPTGTGSILLKKMSDNGAGLWSDDTFSLSQWKGMYTLHGKSGVLLYQGK